MAQAQANKLLNQYSADILEAVKNIECTGKLKYYNRNLYTYVQVDNQFSTKAAEVLLPAGFKKVSRMQKKYSPMTHISTLNNYERVRVQRSRVYSTYKKWKNATIFFKIESVEMFLKRDKETGGLKIVCCLKIRSNRIEFIREDLGWPAKSLHFNMHMSLCEKFL